MLHTLNDCVTSGKVRYIAHRVYYSLLSREFEGELMLLAIDQKVGSFVWSRRRRVSGRQV
jgi:aryl-alcohol dehydrogenase-like predicted oxidoreductase